MTNVDEVQVKDEGPVRWVTLNRPELRNALTLAVNEKLIHAFRAAAADPAVRVVVLAGAGGAFCSGLDLKSVLANGYSEEDFGRVLRSHFQGLARAIRECPKPTLAAVDGPAVGFGCDLALACDLRVASERGVFGETFVKRGLMPDGGGTYLLPRIVGLGRALQMLLAGEMVDAQEALRMGLVGRVVPAAELAAFVQRCAEGVAEGSPLALRRVKEAVYGALDATFAEALEVEADGQAKLLSSKDFLEGVAAFMEKRKPVFQGS